MYRPEDPEPFITWLDPEPGPDALPARFPSPFDDVEPHPLARDAALRIQRDLGNGLIAPGVTTETLNRPEGGKMFGVLIVATPEGRIGALKGFSGQIAGLWDIPGWAPPVFDAPARLVVEPSSDVHIKSLTRRMEELAAGDEFRRMREAASAVNREFAARRTDLRDQYRERRRLRGELRDRLLPGDRTSRRRLDNESRFDDIERRRREADLRAAEREASREFRRLERRLSAMERLRRLVSRRSMQLIHDTYRLTNARGETTTLRALFAPGEPPWGAADCAAPKLLAFAHRCGLRPLALAEFWWGAPPAGGARVQGVFFPACKPKCGPILPFLLDGIDTARRQTWKPDVSTGGDLRILHEDARSIAVSKPAGMLSVPARDAEITDCVLARLRRKFPRAPRLLVVHRLDLDTSGVMIAALDEDAYRFLQTQFTSREVEKRYIAWLDGEPAGESGIVTLPLRLDLDQRPRQIVDFVHGRDAVTEWRVLDRRPGRTRVEFRPRSGRTHQLRVHAAHPKGLAAPIVGDRLYGRVGERLMLHAESIVFTGIDGRCVVVVDPAPF